MDKDFCLNTSAIWQFVGYGVLIVKIIIPIVLIIFGVVELSKCVVSGKDEDIKNVAKKLLTKIALAIAIFFIPTVTRLVFGLIKQASESMVYANGCIECMLAPRKDSCTKAVESAKEYRKTKNAELYKKYYNEFGNDWSTVVDHGGENSQGNPTENPDEPTDNPSDSIPTEEIGLNIPVGTNSFTFKAASGTEYNYWLVTPNNVKKGMPLIVFLHGGGNDVTVAASLTKEQMFNNLVTIDHPYVDVKNIYGSNFPFILLIPHNYASWYTGYSDLYELINKVANNLSIDKRRISITGVSNGGVGAWNFIDKYPSLPASVYIVSGPQPISNLHPENLMNLNIKGISETNNGYYTVMVNNCATINALGGTGSCSITSRSDMTHGTILSVAYPKEVFEWMISKRK